MMTMLLYAVVAFVAVHGLIHLMGFVAYWPLVAIAELPYKTALVGGRWEVGSTGMRVFAVLWLVAAAAFILVVAGFLAGQPWWRPLMLGTIALSTAIIALDWASAYRGGIINAVILLLIL
jgi:hypothetical protein